MNNTILRLLLLDKLSSHNQTAILQAIQEKKRIYSDSWAQRFWARNKLSLRKPTTKMRDLLPIDFEMKKEEFMMILSKTINSLQIPPALWVNLDETNQQFVPTITKTRCPKGTRRIKIIGKGCDFGYYFLALFE